MRYSLLFLFTQVCFLSYSQEYYANTRKIGIDEGLSHYKVLAFYPEQDGMWIGTGNGLNFFNGYEWKYWTKDKGQGQGDDNKVNYIHKDQDGLLWLFNTKERYFKRNVHSIDIVRTDLNTTFSFEQYFDEKAPFKREAIQQFFEDQEQSLYFFADQQLWRYTANRSFENIKIPEGFEPITVFSDGTYAGELENKLVLVSAEGRLLFTSDYELSENVYKVVGNSKTFWVMQDRATCKKFERQADGSYKRKLFPIQQEKGKLFALMYYDEKKNHIWVKKEPYIYMFDGDDQLLYQQKLAPRVACVDYNDNIWMGKFEVTIIRPQKKRFDRFLFQKSKEVSNNERYRCRGIIEEKGKLYINTYRGLRIIDLKTDEIIASLDKKASRSFVSLKDQNDQIWFAGDKIFQLNDDNEIIYLDDRDEDSKRIWSMFEDRTGRIWVGGRGLSYIEDEKIKAFEQYNEFKALEEAIVLFFYKDKNGVIWIGSNNGLYQLDLKKGIIASYGKNKMGAFQMPSSKFQHMYQDAQGIFWLATEDAGLIKWNKATGDIQQYNTDHGLLSNNIYGVYEDEFSCLWLSSFNGLIQFHMESEQITVYNKEEGISDNEFNRIAHYQAEDGTIYFGSQNGVTAFHPKDFVDKEPNKEAFKLSIKHISAFGLKTFKDTLMDGSKIDLMKLGPGIKAIDIEMACSDLFWTSEVDLQYTLEPIGKYRKEILTYKDKRSADNHIELFGIHPGTYQLEVKAIHKNGKQIGETAFFALKIAKPITHQPIFWVFVILAMAVCIWAYIKLRTTRLRKRQIELETMVTERTNQILKDQKTIKTQAHQIEEMKDQLNRKDERWLEQFQTIIKDRLDDPDLYLPSIIDDMDISRSVFYEKVRTLTKMTPNQYIQELRLTKAKAILDEGNVKTVKEVAYAIGMKRPSYFSKLFKERFGILPSAYFRDHSN